MRDNWMDREALTRLWTVPIEKVVSSEWDLGSYAVEFRILRPLTWFGLLHFRREVMTGVRERRLYRKTPLLIAS
jgi:hypothetical protein